jgi:hypothetical protein
VTPADPYWSQFAHVVQWDRTPKIVGKLEGRRSEGPKDNPYPVLMLRTDNGYALQINVTQVRLLSELVRLRPDIGDRIEITYDGEAPKAPPGMSPAKEFTVHVERQGSPPPPVNINATSGESANTAAEEGGT